MACYRHRVIAPLTLIAAFVPGSAAYSQDIQPDPSADVEPPRSSPSPDTGDAAASGEEAQPTIVVTARRGEALVAAERELSDEEIGVYGADTIQQLVERIAPEIDGSEDLPELIINGKRVDPAMIKAFPPDALARLAVLDPEAAAKYGFDPGKRVINLVLKQNYAKWNAVGTLSDATRGGRLGEALNLGRFLIKNDLQWTLQGNISHQNALLKADRDIPLYPDEEQAVMAGLDPQRFDTLLPSTTSVSLNTGLTHPIGEWSGTVMLNANATDSEGLRGFSPGEYATADRPAPSPLEANSSSRTVTAFASLSGTIGEWRTTSSVNFAKTWSESRFDRPTSSVDPGRLTDRRTGSSTTLTAQLNARRDVVSLPAGEAGLTLDLQGENGESTSTVISNDGDVGKFRSVRRSGRLRAAVDLPVAKRALEVLQPLGDLSVELGTTAETVANEKLRWQWNVGGNWAPFEGLRIRADYEFEQRLPAVEQLAAPLQETVDRVFDFARQEVVEIVRITGGNPALQNGSVRNYSINAQLSPFRNRLLTLSVDYRRSTQRGGISSLPPLTPAIEAAFPDRFERNADGRLIAIDARPINIESETSAELSTGVTLSWNSQGANPVALRLSGYHRLRLEDRLVVGPGIAPVDKLQAGATPRQSATFQLVGGMQGLSLTIRGNWSGEARAAGDTGLKYAPMVLLGLETSIEPEHLWADEAGWAKDLKISLDVQNLLASYRRVITADGTAAPGYERDLIDPIGRTVRLTLTKAF